MLRDASRSSLRLKFKPVVDQLFEEFREFLSSLKATRSAEFQAETFDGHCFFKGSVCSYVGWEA